jgi:O-antigen ligase/Tfp pilus assembly protein PilF
VAPAINFTVQPMSSVLPREREAPGTGLPAASRASSQTARALAFGLAFVIATYYALRGGSYDTVVRQGEATVVWLALAVGAALGLLPRARLPAGAAVPLAAVVLLAGWTALSLAWTQGAEQSFAEVARVIHYAGVVVLIWALVDRDTWSPAMAGLATAGCFVCCFALATRLAPAVFGESDVARLLQTKRLDQPLNYWNAVATWAGMSIAIALAYSSHARRRLARCLSLAVLPICGATAYLTYSRGGTVGAVVGVLVVIALSRNRWVAGLHALAAGIATWVVVAQIRAEREIAEGLGSAGAWKVAAVLAGASTVCAGVALLTHFLRGEARWRLPRREGRRAATVATLAAVVALAVIGTVYGGELWHDFRHAGATSPSLDPRIEVSNPSASRYVHWRSALRTFRDHPLRGTGAGTSVFRLNRSIVGADKDTHSLYLEQLAELGLPGLILTLAFLGGLLTLAARARDLVPGIVVGAQVAAVGAFAVFLVDAAVDWMWEVTAVSVLALAVIALAASAGAAPRRPTVHTRLGIVAVSIVACVVQVPGLVSNLRVRDSQEAFRSGAIARALDDADDAVAAEPWASTAYAQRALVSESTGDLPNARRDLLRAIARGRDDYRYELLLARVDAEMGRVSSSERAFARARRLRPVGAFTVAP